MRTLLIIILLAGIYSCTSINAKDSKQSTSASTSSNKIVLELFTSQGCSSCPSADKLVSSLAGQDTNLIVLSFHVDYWDRLGWKDAFSNHQYTERQEQYVKALHAESLYTPQAIVGGQYEMVGSNRTGISNALQKVRGETTGSLLSAKATIADNTITIHYDVNKLSANEKIYFALVQTNASTNIARGENAGVQLSGYNVVRDFIMMPLSKPNDTTEIKIPTDLQPNNASVVVFIQDNISQKITAATSVKITS